MPIPPIDQAVIELAASLAAMFLGLLFTAIVVAGIVALPAVLWIARRPPQSTVRVFIVQDGKEKEVPPDDDSGEEWKTGPDEDES